MPQKRLVFTFGDLKKLILETYKEVEEVTVFHGGLLEISDFDGISLTVDDDTFIIEGISNK